MSPKRIRGVRSQTRRLGSRQVWEVDIVWLHVKMTCDVLKKGALLWYGARNGKDYWMAIGGGFEHFYFHPYLILREWTSWISWDFIKKHKISYLWFWVISDKANISTSKKCHLTCWIAKFTNSMGDLKTQMLQHLESTRFIPPKIPRVRHRTPPGSCYFLPSKNSLWSWEDG